MGVFDMGCVPISAQYDCASNANENHDLDADIMSRRTLCGWMTMRPWSDATETLLLCAVAGSSHGAFFFPESLTQQKRRKTKQVERVNHQHPQ